MTIKKMPHVSRSTISQTPFSDAEVHQLLKEAEQQYEEYIHLANLADLAEAEEVISPRYEWDKPIGLVVTRTSNGKLV